MTDFSWKYFAPLFAGMLLVGCATKPAGHVAITKVNPFHLNESNTIVTAADPMLEFEPKRLLHGAVGMEEYRERYGHYYTVFWTTETRAAATVKLEYRQGSSGSRILSKEISVAAPKKKNTTKFEVIGDEYHKGGKVTQWKVSIFEGGTKVAEYKSFLWKD